MEREQISGPGILEEVIARSLEMINHQTTHQLRHLTEFILSKPHDWINHSMHNVTMRLVRQSKKLDSDIKDTFEMSLPIFPFTIDHFVRRDH